jgi:dTMP kinase
VHGRTGALGDSRLAHFIVIEGIDGAGTSTQARAVRDALAAHGRQAVETFEPTRGPIGALLREMLAGRVPLCGRSTPDKRIFALLFAADRQHHLERQDDGIARWLEGGADVVCARYVLSSLAYEADDPAELERVRQLQAGFAVPHLTVYLECPVDVALRRIASTRASVDVFENRTELERVKANYDRVLASYEGPVLRVDATRPANAITAAVLERLDVR